MEIGEEIYQENKEEIEENHRGEYVIIDTEMKKIIGYGDNPLEALGKGKKSSPNSLYIRRVGRMDRLL